MSKRRFFAWFGAIVTLFVVFAAGVYVGVIVGVDQFQMLESSAKASILTRELNALRSRRIEELVVDKEIMLDGQVVTAIAFQDAGMPWLFWPYMHSWDHARSLRAVAQYRQQYPPVSPKHAPAPEANDPLDLRGYAREVTRSTEVLIERYGK
jgi:hypothetical protein